MFRHTDRAGFVPYFRVDGRVEFLFMISSDPHFGGDKPAIAKGKIDDGESSLTAALREAHEELGLRESNLVEGTIQKKYEEMVRGISGEYRMKVYVGEVKDISAFDQPHYETKETVWLTLEEFKKKGRHTHVKIMETIARGL